MHACVHVYIHCYYSHVVFLDFGFAHYVIGETEADILRGSPLYMAPEIITKRQYDEKADLWSVGVILYGQFILKSFTENFRVFFMALKSYG